jgi:hypothetical protein
MTGMTISYVKQAKRLLQARQGQLKLDAEINHAPDYQAVWSVLRLATFMQGNNSGVSQGIVWVETKRTSWFYSGHYRVSYILLGMSHLLIY